MYIYKIIFGFIPKALPGTFISVAFNGQNPVLPPSDTQLEGDRSYFCSVFVIVNLAYALRWVKNLQDNQRQLFLNVPQLTTIIYSVNMYQKYELGKYLLLYNKLLLCLPISSFSPYQDVFPFYNNWQQQD